MGFLFEDLRVYKAAMEFAVKVYTLNGSLQDKNIKDQLRRASLSVTLNIAEGQGRIHIKEKRQFYNTARGSLLECIPLIQICEKIGYISNDKYMEFYELATEISKMLSGLINSLKNLEIR